MLFNIVLERVIKDITEDRKMNLGELDVLLAYADDIVTMRNSRDDVKHTTKNSWSRAR